MASTKVKGIIIESKDSKEKDKIVTIYTLELGKVRAIFRGVRGEKAKMKAAKELFTFGEFFIENTKGNNIISQVDIIETFHGLSSNLDKYYEACSIIDIIKKLGNEQSEPRLFIESVKALKTICFENLKPHYVLDKFLIDLFASTGYDINFDICSSCKSKITGKRYINYDFGEIVCGGCRTATAEEVPPVVISTLKILKGIDYDKLNTITLSPNAEIQSLVLLLKNFECRFGMRIFNTIM